MRSRCSRHSTGSEALVRAGILAQPSRTSPPGSGSGSTPMLASLGIGMPDLAPDSAGGRTRDGARARLRLAVERVHQRAARGPGGRLVSAVLAAPPLESVVRARLAEVDDPEIPTVSIVDLGHRPGRPREPERDPRRAAADVRRLPGAGRAARRRDASSLRPGDVRGRDVHVRRAVDRGAHHTGRSSGPAGAGSHRRPPQRRRRPARVTGPADRASARSAVRGAPRWRMPSARRSAVPSTIAPDCRQPFEQFKSV